MVKVYNHEYAKDKKLLNKYQGKKAVLLKHDCTFGFEIGETVAIAGVKQGYNGKLQFEIINNGGNGGIHGFVDEGCLRFIREDIKNIDEDTNIVNVEIGGFKIEGTKAVVIDAIKQLHEIAMTTTQPDLTSKLAIIKQGCGDKNCLHGFDDGMLVKIVAIDNDNVRFKYRVKNFVNDSIGWASDEELIFLNDLDDELNDFEEELE